MWRRVVRFAVVVLVPGHLIDSRSATWTAATEKSSWAQLGQSCR